MHMCVQPPIWSTTSSSQRLQAQAVGDCSFALPRVAALLAPASPSFLPSIPPNSHVAEQQIRCSAEQRSTSSVTAAVAPAALHFSLWWWGRASRAFWEARGLTDPCSATCKYPHGACSTAELLRYEVVPGFMANLLSLKHFKQPEHVGTCFLVLLCRHILHYKSKMCPRPSSSSVCLEYFTQVGSVAPILQAGKLRSREVM